MLKRFFLALYLTVGLLSPAYSAGTIGLSLTQRIDTVTGKVLNGGKLYFIQAGTTSTPQNAFQDSALTIPWPNPITLDAGGNIPQLFFADGQIKIRLTNAAGVTQIVADNILVVGASSGGGGGGTVDPTTVMQTGHVEVFYGTGSLSGFVRANGRTIGPSGSGATERGALDVQALFLFLWNTDPNLAVSGGRGVSAAADWSNGTKTIALPDYRGRALAGLDDMGNSAAGRLTSTYFGTAATVLGAAGGLESSSLVTLNLPAYTPSGTIAVTGTTPVKELPLNSTGANQLAYVPGGTSGTDNIPLSVTSQVFTGTAQGGTSAAFKTATPTILATIYLKL